MIKICLKTGFCQVGPGGYNKSCIENGHRDVRLWYVGGIGKDCFLGVSRPAIKRTGRAFQGCAVARAPSAAGLNPYNPSRESGSSL